jgi:hypothetical protein
MYSPSVYDFYLSLTANIVHSSPSECGKICLQWNLGKTEQNPFFVRTCLWSWNYTVKTSVNVHCIMWKQRNFLNLMESSLLTFSLL